MPATASLYDRLSALADPIRSRILLAVERQELTVSELRSALQLPQSTVSRHLKVLADEDTAQRWKERLAAVRALAANPQQVGSGP